MTSHQAREQQERVAKMRAEVKAMPKGPRKKVAGAIVRNLASIGALQRKKLALRKSLVAGNQATSTPLQCGQG